MKQIVKRNTNFSFTQKLIVFIIFLALLVSIYFSLKFVKTKIEIIDFVYSSKIETPICSSNGGFYAEPFVLKLEHSSSNLKIYFTIDGTKPTSNSTIYTHPILIEEKKDVRNYLSLIPTSPRWKPPIDEIYKGTTLRAIAVDENNFKSAELVKTFFIDEKKYKKYSVPIICLTIDEKDFFGYKTGIYVLGKSYGDKDNYLRKNISLDLPWWEYPSNYLMRGGDAERSANIEFYETNGNLAFQSTVGIRINGNATRGFAQKSLRISFNRKNGLKQLNYQLFPNYDLKQFNSFILRNSGNDWDKTMFRDAFMQSLMQNSKLDIQMYRATIVFINGEYWGIHNLRERFDENYIANKYKITKDSIAILELGGSLSFGSKQDVTDFKSFLNFVKSSDLSQEKNYEYIKSKIDIESFSDFIIANVYYCNSDWPNNNVKFWRYKRNENLDSVFAKDGRWRWMLYDTDWGFGFNSDANLNLLKKATQVGSVGILFTALLKNKKFEKMFIERFTQYVNTNFETTKVLAKINEMEQTLAPEMQEHIDRWRMIGSYDKWKKNVEEMRNFAKNRPSIQINQLKEFFNSQSNGKKAPPIN